MNFDVLPCWFTYPHREHNREAAVGSGLWQTCPGQLPSDDWREKQAKLAALQEQEAGGEGRPSTPT